MTKSEIDNLYKDTFEKLKHKIKSAQIKASLAVNKELILLYWHIGHAILVRQRENGWGGKVIKKLSMDLRKSFPNMKGFSQRNLLYMKQFAEQYPEIQIAQAVPAQLTWYHNCTLMDKVPNLSQRDWYIKKAVKHGWSRNVMLHQIESKLFDRQADKNKKVNNFSKTLSSLQSDLAHEMLKDPYKFDFLILTDNANEKEIENQLVSHITNFLLELGAGFAYIGKQVHFELGDTDFYIDLLFYHTKLRCYIVIELKNGKFKPDYIGKLNFYMNLIDEKLKHQSDNPTIGLLLCKEKNKLVAEYALKDINKPIGVSEYQLLEALPENLKTSLPSIDEIESELSR